MKVIALVASAGGLSGLQEVLSGLPRDLPAAVITLQHTSPDRTSLLSAILQRSATMPVQEAADGDELRAGRVFVTPPGHHTLVTPTRRFALVVAGRYPPFRPSADLLLTTMAMAVGSDALAVVMSGGGNDGATGATVVHNRGGLVVASDPGTSEYPSMPAATIDRDHITDAVIPVPQLASYLVQLVLAPALTVEPS